jgi:hypothetical protein
MAFGPTINGKGPRRTGLAMLLAAASILLPIALAHADSPPRSTSTVGMPAKIGSLVLPGSELEVKPLEDRRAPVVVRIAEVYPHGSAFRYDLVYYGLEPGTHDLRDYLRRKDGTPVGDLPSIPVKVNPVLPPGQIEPNPLVLDRSPSLGGYRLVLAIGGSLWFAGLAAILLLGRRKRALEEAAASRPLTLAERLRPLVDAAIAGTLDEGRHAELERLLIGYWRKRLGLEQASPAEAIAVMRRHDEAGPLLRRLEEWLHKPGAGAGAAEIASLLRPYQGLMVEDEDRENGLEAASGPASPSSERRT